MGQERYARFQRMRHARAVQAIEQRAGHVDRQIGEQELLQWRERAIPGVAEVFRFELRETLRSVLSPPKARIVDSRAQGGRGDLRPGEETLESAVEKRGIAESHGILTKIIPAAHRRARQA